MESEQHSSLYNSYSSYLRRLYREVTYRVGIDAGFSCPHRVANRGWGGCSFCDERGSRAPYQLGTAGIAPDSTIGDRIRSVSVQAQRGIEFLKKRYKATSFILYFQAFSSTYAPLDELKEIYDAGLAVHPFRELIISTRPDCVDEGVADLLGDYVRRGLPVWVELGLQSSCDSTLKRINRGHSVNCFDEALDLLREKGILLAAHVIFGLPGEGRREMMRTVDYLAEKRIDGIKIHDLHIPRGSALFGEYLSGELALPSELRHLSYVVEALERLPEKTIIMRLTCDTPGETRGFPLNPPAKERFVRRVQDELGRRGSRQGIRCASALRCG